MNENLELDRLAKENDNLFWDRKNLDCRSSFLRVTVL